MVDEWTGTLPDGRRVTYSREWLPDAGGVMKAEVEGGVIKWTAIMRTELTRTQVEAAFAAHLNQK
jgi:hypothetical protein